MLLHFLIDFIQRCRICVIRNINFIFKCTQFVQFDQARSNCFFCRVRAVDTLRDVFKYIGTINKLGKNRINFPN